jgi:hypothetical protein
MSREAMKQALDALGYVMSHGAQVQIAKDILSQAIEQAEKQEPVAWASGLDFDDDDQEIIPAKDKGKLGTSNCDIPLYTVPKQWVGLTDDEMEALFLNEDGVRFARYIESRLKDKNA